MNEGVIVFIAMSLAGSKAEVLRQQQPRSYSDSTQNRDNGAQKGTVSSLVPPSKSSFRVHMRFVDSSSDLFRLIH